MLITHHYQFIHELIIRASDASDASSHMTLPLVTYGVSFFPRLCLTHTLTHTRLDINKSEGPLCYTHHCILQHKLTWVVFIVCMAAEAARLWRDLARARGWVCVWLLLLHIDVTIYHYSSYTALLHLKWLTAALWVSEWVSVCVMATGRRGGDVVCGYGFKYVIIFHNVSIHIH